MFNQILKNKSRKILSLGIAGVLLSLLGNSIKLQHNIVQAQVKPRIVVSHNIICDLVQTIAEDTDRKSVV